MAAHFCSPAPGEHEPDGELIWSRLRMWLLPHVVAWTYSSHVVIWYGQQWDIAEEIVQEAIMRTFECVQRAMRNEGPPVICPEAFCYKIAQHLFLDRLRKEQRLMHFVFSNDAGRTCAIKDEQANAAELAVDHLSNVETIINAVRSIVRFPDKQREAMLIAMANAIDLDMSPSFLEQALAEYGTQLSDYVRPRSNDPTERGRHSALLWNARKRLKGNS
jgi:DNA-directed RNA polymerase specialized sigma24 family protein